jgi:AhpD family alkylhydroperoxidase
MACTRLVRSREADDMDNGNATNGSSTKIYAEIELYLAETVLPNKDKELIGIAVSGATRCSYCALFHIEAAKVYGATDGEVAEASYMGAFTMLESTFVNAESVDREQLRRETLDIVKLVKSQQARSSSGEASGQAHVR